MATALSLILTILGIVGPIASILGALGIFKVVAAKVDAEGDKLVADAKPADKPLAEAERGALHAAADLLRNGSVTDGLAKLETVLKSIPKPKS